MVSAHDLNILLYLLMVACPSTVCFVILDVSTLEPANGEEVILSASTNESSVTWNFNKTQISVCITSGCFPPSSSGRTFTRTATTSTMTISSYDCNTHDGPYVVTTANDSDNRTLKVNIPVSTVTWASSISTEAVESKELSVDITCVYPTTSIQINFTVQTAGEADKVLQLSANNIQTTGNTGCLCDAESLRASYSISYPQKTVQVLVSVLHTLLPNKGFTTLDSQGNITFKGSTDGGDGDGSNKYLLFLIVIIVAVVFGSAIEYFVFNCRHCKDNTTAKIVYVQEKDSVVIGENCEDTTDSAIAKWTKNKEILPTTSNTHVIKNASRQDEGFYVSTFKKTVLKYTVIVVGTEETKYVENGCDITIGKIIGDAHATANAKWTKNGREITLPNSEGTTLCIQKASVADEGSYVCTFGEHGMQLTYNLIVVGTDETKHVAKGLSIELGKTIKDDVAVATAKWTKSEEEGKQIKSNGTRLLISKAKAKHKGIYVCTFGLQNMQLKYHLYVEDPKNENTEVKRLKRKTQENQSNTSLELIDEKKNPIQLKSNRKLTPVESPGKTDGSPLELKPVGTPLPQQPNDISGLSVLPPIT